jgi:hypothetical protein
MTFLGIDFVYLQTRWAETRLYTRIIKKNLFFSFDATAPIWALAYLHETLRFVSVY